MKAVVLFALLCWMTWPAAAQQKTLKSEVSAVTVYSDRATVTHSASVQLVEGDYEFAFNDLPYALDDQSLRVEGSGTAKAKISEIRIETVYIDTLPKNALKELQEQMTVLSHPRCT